MLTPTTTSLAASAHSRNTQIASPPPPPLTNDIIQQLSAIERLAAEAAEEPVPAAALRPFLATLRVYLTQGEPLKRIEAKLDKLSATLAKGSPQPTTYAQAARRGIASESHASHASHASHSRDALIKSPKEAKLVRIRFSNKEDAQKLQTLPIEAILSGLQEQAGETPAIKGIIAVKKLPGGDLLLHTDSATTRDKLQEVTSWTAKLGPTAKIH